MQMNLNRAHLAVYVITDRSIVGNRSLFDVVRAAIRGGATLVQLREKEAPTDEIIAIGRTLHQITREAGIPLIVNDRADVALELDAEGLHIGQQDLSPPEARRLIGPHRILGMSAETVEQALQAEHSGADYLGVGDVYGTRSKPDAGNPIGLDGLAAIARAVTLPIVAIGGITLDNTAAIIRSGADGVSVISAVMAAPDPEAAARHLRRVVDEEQERRRSDENRKKGRET
jgi:thiamine-phosphate pyrophosphorylase